MFSFHIDDPLSAQELLFWTFHWLLLHFYCIIVKVGVLALCRVSLVNSDKLISPLNLDKNSSDQSVRIKRSRLHLIMSKQKLIAILDFPFLV